MKQNIYQMYHANGCKFGFVVQRNSWNAGTVARIIKIQGTKEGEVINGLLNAPYFNNPKVMAEFYRDGVLYDTNILPCAGTFGYTWIK